MELWGWVFFLFMPVYINIWGEVRHLSCYIWLEVFRMLSLLRSLVSFKCSQIVSAVFNQGCFWQTDHTQYFNLQVQWKLVFKGHFLLLSAVIKAIPSSKAETYQMMCPHHCFIPQWNVPALLQWRQPALHFQPRNCMEGDVSNASRELREQLPKSHSTFSRLEQVPQPGNYITVAAEEVLPDIFMLYETWSPWNKLHSVLILVISG